MKISSAEEWANIHFTFYCLSNSKSLVGEESNRPWKVDTHCYLDERLQSSASRMSAPSSFKTIPPEIKQQAVRKAVKSQFAVSSKDHSKNRLQINLSLFQLLQGWHQLTAGFHGACWPAMCFPLLLPSSPISSLLTTHLQCFPPRLCSYLCSF